LHCMLFIVEIALAIRYFSKFNAHRRFNVVVGFLVANAIVTLIATCAYSWKLLITYRVAPPKRHLWTFSVMVICKNIASTLEQCFLLYRYYGLSRSIFWTALVLLTIVVHLGAGFTIAIDFLVHPTFGYPIGNMARTISFCVNAAIDIVIPILLIWELRGIGAVYSSTQSLVQRLIVNAASSGCCVALAEIFILVLFWTQPHLLLLGCNILGPFYGITVLVNLFVCQSGVPATTAMQTKTANLTTLDSVEVYGSIDPLRFHGHLRDIKEPSDGTGNQSSDYGVTTANSPLSEKF